MKRKKTEQEAEDAIFRSTTEIGGQGKEGQLATGEALLTLALVKNNRTSQ